MKKTAAVVFAVLMLLTGGCGEGDRGAEKPAEPILTETMSEDTAENGYADGIYRGFYKKDGVEELAVQFELVDNRFSSVTFRGMKYKDGDYLSGEATDIQRQIVKQYRQAAGYLVGKEPEAVEEILSPEKVTENMDAVTSATLNTDKLAAAVNDGLKRNVFKPASSQVVILTGDYEDGVYRGVYDDGGVEQVAVTVTVKNNRFVSVQYDSLNYGGRDYLKEGLSGVMKEIAEQYREAADYLEGRRLPALADLYDPEGLVADRDAVTGPTLRTNKLISAVNKALADGPCEKLQ